MWYSPEKDTDPAQNLARQPGVAHKESAKGAAPNSNSIAAPPADWNPHFGQGERAHDAEERAVVETDKGWLNRAQDVDAGGTRAVHAHDQDGRLTECQRKRMTQKGSEMAGGVCGKHRLSGGSSRAKRECLLFWRGIEHIKSRDLQIRIEAFGGLCRTRIALHQPGRSRGARRSHCTGPG